MNDGNLTGKGPTNRRTERGNEGSPVVGFSRSPLWNGPGQILRQGVIKYWVRDERNKTKDSKECKII